MNGNRDKGESYVRRQAKATSAGFSRFSGSGAHSSRRSGLAFLGALVLAITVSLGAAAAIADAPPAVTIDNGPTAEYTTAEVSGTVNPSGGPSPTNWHFEYTTAPADEFSWQPGPGGEISGPGAEGVAPVPVNGKVEFLQPQTEYSVRLVAENEGGANRVVTDAPYPTFTTKGPVNKATVTIDAVTTFTDATAHFTGTVNPGATSSDPGFNVDYQFHCTPDCSGNLSGQVAADNVNHTVEGSAVGLEPNIDYTVELTATNAGGSESAGPRLFKTTALAPNAETMPAFAIQGGTEALVGGRINPKNSATVYWIEYGSTSDYGKSLPVSKDASAGSGSKGQILTQTLTGLTPSTEYHFRVVAKNASGETPGHDLNFETAPAGGGPEPLCNNELLRNENNSTALPECRAYEQVSPVDKNGYSISNSVVVGEGGSTLAFESTGAFGDAQAAATVNSYLARRGSDGWWAHGLDPLQSPRPYTEWPHFLWYSPDLRYATLVNPPNSTIAPGDNIGEYNLYLRDNLTDTFHTLTLESSLGVAGSDPSTPRVVFANQRALAPGAVAGQSNVYEWDDGQIQLASIGTDGNPMPGGASLSRAIEVNGTSAVIFQGEDGTGLGPLFLRKGGQTIEVSASQRSTPDPGGSGLTHFWGASTDGSKIFFTDTEALTDDAQPNSSDGSIKLYQYDVDTNTVTDLTASALGLEFVESVAAVSADGSYVYFRSLSQFHPGENETGKSALYVWHDGTVTFIGSDPTSGLEATQMESITYRISPNGQHLSFTTISRMTSYDNTDSAPDGNGDPRQDSEVYTYDAGANRLTCVSCNPNGQRPTGSPAGGADGGSSVPRPPDDQLKNLQPGVADDGRIFFNSRDALVPEDVNGKQDVYEWRDGRVHLISSGTDGSPASLSSSSPSGDDVFITTRAQLVAADRDEIVDLYDVRVGGGFPRAATPSPCEGLEGCHGPASGVPPFTDPASGSFSSPLERLSPSAQRLRKALKACKHKPGKARAKCRAAAKKRHGKASNGRAH